MKKNESVEKKDKASEISFYLMVGGLLISFIGFIGYMVYAMLN